MNTLSALLLGLGLLISSALGADIQVQVPGEALAYQLAPAAASDIKGQSIALSPFILTVITNTTHALVSFEIPKEREAVGWIAMGFGTSMADSSMVILWPNSIYTNWTLSARSVGGYAVPLVSTNNYAGVYTQASPLDLMSVRSGCRASFIRPLELPANQDVYPQGHTTQLNMTRSNEKQKLIFAFSSNRPDSDDIDSLLDKHDAGNQNFGPIEVDLSQHFLAGSAASNQANFQQRAVFAHAALGTIAWGLLAPIGVLIPRFCRGNPKWCAYHRIFQGFLVFPLTIVILALGLYGGQGAGSLSSSHQICGILLGILVFCQVAVGQIAHGTPAAGALGQLGDGRSSTRSPSRVMHIVLGSVVMLVSIIQVQLGLKLYSGGKLATFYLVIVVGFLTVFLLLVCSSLATLIRLRHNEGRSWAAALLGLGRVSASSPRSRIYPRRPNHDSAPSIIIEGGLYGDVKMDDRPSLSTPRRRSFQVEPGISLQDEDTASTHYVKMGS